MSYWKNVEAARRAVADPAVSDAVADAVADAVNETLGQAAAGFKFYLCPTFPETVAPGRPLTFQIDWNAGGLTGTVCFCYTADGWKRTAGRCLSPLGMPLPAVVVSTLAEIAASGCAVLDDATVTFKD